MVKEQSPGYCQLGAKSVAFEESPGGTHGLIVNAAR
jgi:hypothetical protein